MQWWGPKGFTAPFCKMDFRVGGEFLCCMRAPDGQEFWNAGEYHEIVLREKIVSSMYFSDPQGNKVEPAQYGIEHEAMADVHDVITFEDFGNGQTKLTFIWNETMESAKNSGQVEGWNQILDKLAAVVAGLLNWGDCTVKKCGYAKRAIFFGKLRARLLLRPELLILGSTQMR
jgi:uncharacterized protein YndB with AHSA1/START domain